MSNWMYMDVLYIHVCFLGGFDDQEDKNEILKFAFWEFDAKVSNSQYLLMC